MTNEAKRNENTVEHLVRHCFICSNISRKPKGFIRKLILQDGQPHCGITGHPIENNYAAVFHAKRCDKFQPNDEAQLRSEAE